MKHTAHFPTRKWLKKKQQQKLDLSQLPTVLLGSLQMYLINLRRAVSNKAFISSGDKSVKFILDIFPSKYNQTFPVWVDNQHISVDAD